MSPHTHHADVRSEIAQSQKKHIGVKVKWESIYFQESQAILTRRVTLHNLPTVIHLAYALSKYR